MPWSLENTKLIFNEIEDENINFVVTDSDQSNSDKNMLKIEKRAESDISHRR